MTNRPKAGQLELDEVKNLAALSDSLLLDTEPYVLSNDEHTPLDHTLYAVKALRESLLMKYEYENSKNADAAAEAKFRAINEDCKNWSLTELDETDQLLLGELKSTLYRFYYPNQVEPILSSPSAIAAEGGVGPGASIGTKAKDFYQKLFAGPLSSTSSSLYMMYKAYVSAHPLLREAERNRQRAFGDPIIVKGDKLSFVPKKVDISRCTFPQPSLNMYFQLGVGKILARRLSSFFGIDISRIPGSEHYVQQEKNRELAQLGSMFEGSYVTIDLSSASDSLALGMLREVLPSSLLDWLLLFRSPVSKMPDGSELELHMVSTMGNGFTFPLQTMLFLSVVYAAYRVAGLPLLRPRGLGLGNFGVFGDDIIVEAQASPYVFRLLKILGFKVNSDKTYVKGPFRESCGGDFYKGHDVRPFFLKALRSTQDVYVAINALNLWTSKVGISLPRAVRFLMSLVPEFNPVPLHSNFDSGVMLPRSLVRSWDRDPHIQAVKFLKWVPRPPKLFIGCEVTYGRRKKRKGSWGFDRPPLLYNPEGLYVAFLGGYVEHSAITLRHQRVRYVQKEDVTPFWDYIPEGVRLARTNYCLPLGTAISINTGL